MNATERVMLNSARAEVLLDAEAGCTPCVETQDIEAFLASSARAHVWETSTSYQYGDIVQPVVRNGHRYRCLAGGTSGGSSPTFPKGIGATVTDGPNIVWVEEGPDYPNVYDVRAALEAIWTQKAEKAASLVDSREGGSASQIQAQCRERAAGYAAMVFA